MLPRTLFLWLLSLAVAVLAAADSDPDADLICPNTVNKSDCYLRIFVPSQEFQIVRADQQIPSGLHVRMDIQTGLKEAKLYDSAEDDSALEAVEVFPEGQESEVNEEGQGDQEAQEHESKYAVQAIDAPDVSPDTPESPDALYSAFFQNALDREQRSNTDSDADNTAFKEALSVLISTHPDPQHDSQPGSHPETLLSALSTLSELAHDIYWGHSLSQSSPGINALVSLLHSRDPELVGAAALVLGTTVRNNAPALEEVLVRVAGLAGVVRDVLFAPGDQQAQQTEQQSEQPSNSRHPSPRCPPAQHPLPQRTYTRLLSLLSALLAHPPAANTFLASGDLTRLLSDFQPLQVLEDPEWTRPRQGIADLVLDRFAGGDVAGVFTRAEWAAWNLRRGQVGQAELERLGEQEWVLVDREEVEERGGESQGWRMVRGGGEDGMWVREMQEKEEEEGERSVEPVGYVEGYEEAMVRCCEVFQEAMGLWEFDRVGAEGEGEMSGVEEHVREAMGQVRERLGELGCEGCECRKDEKRIRDEL